MRRRSGEKRGDWRAASLLVTASMLAGAPHAAAAVHPLDVAGPNSDVIEQPASMAPKLDPFGRWVVYVADSEFDGLFELWSAPLAGGDPIRLSTGMQYGDEIGQFEISADGTFVAFLWAIQESLPELYLVPIDGGTPLKKNHDLGQGESVDRLAISADSQWLVYRARIDDGSFQLFRVEVSGSNPAKYDYTNAYPACTSTVDDFVLSPDSAHVAFRVVMTGCSPEVYPGDSLYRAAIGGTATTLLIETLPHGVVPQFEFTSPIPPDPSILLLISDIDSPDSPKYQGILRWDDGTPFGSHTVISGAMVTGANVTSFRLVPFSDYVVFRADRELDNHFELWRNTVGLPFVQAPVQLHEQLSTDVTHLYDVTWDGARVAFVQESDLIGGFPAYLRSASIASPGATTLLDSISDPGRFAQLEIAGDDVVYLADKVPDRLELFAVPAAGGTVTRMNPIAEPLVVEWDVLNLAITPDGSRVHFSYQSELLISPFSVVSEIRSAPVPGGPSVAYGPSLDAAGTGARFYDLLAPLDERWAVSLGDATIAGRLQLYVSDACLFCDGFEGTGDGRSRWD